jgi:hypothetical protein
MTTVGDVKKFIPVRVIVYPPKMSPYLGEKEVTMAVLAAEYMALLGKAIVLKPSS